MVKKIQISFAKIMLHLAFWCAVLVFYTLVFGYKSQGWYYPFCFGVYLLPITIAAAYFVSNFLIPRYLLVKKRLRFILYSFYTLIVTIYLVYLSIFIALYGLANLAISEMAPITRHIGFVLSMVLLVVFVISTIKMIQLYYEQKTAKQTAENNLLENQLSFKKQELDWLKLQIQPHFLFNALNTIYGLALTQDSETPKAITNLSEMLDYVLYQSKAEHIDLQKEINHIQHYVAFQKLRMDGVLHYEESIALHKKISIGPLLLQPFLENAFKHGAAIKGVFLVALSIKTEGEVLCFTLKNSCLSQPNSTMHGLGIKNVRERLSLLYPGRHKLQTTKSASEYIVELKIERPDE